MKFWSLFKRKPDDEQAPVLRTSATDDFADSILIELKSVVNASVASALEDLEGRYLKSILEDSCFVLESVVITAQDANAMSRLEDLLARHEQVEPGFRARFFRLVVQREYRSTRGSMVRPVENLEPTVEWDSSLLETTSDDENYLVSLRGRRLRFGARVVLGGPQRRVGTGAPTGAVPAAVAATTSVMTNRHSETTRARQITLRIHDRHGLRQFSSPLPVLLGREQEGQVTTPDIHRVDLAGTYASRRQLVLFELMGQLYAMVPTEASLTCRTQYGLLMEPDRVIRIEEGQALELVVGLPAQGSAGMLEIDDPAQHPRVQVGAGSALAVGDGTPRPRGFV